MKNRFFGAARNKYTDSPKPLFFCPTWAIAILLELDARVSDYQALYDSYECDLISIWKMMHYGMFELQQHEPRRS